MNEKWNNRFIELAEYISQWSKDPSTKVGAVLVNPVKKTIIGMGYNGFPRGVEDTEERLTNRTLKYPIIIHAEENALLNAVSNPENSYCFVTHHPCTNCAGKLIQSGIKRVYTRKPQENMLERWKPQFDLSASILKEANVDLLFI